MTRIGTALMMVASALAAPASAQQLRRPVACESCIANWYYFDQIYDPEAGASRRQDWSCGTSTYDDHRGTDFSLAGGNGAISGGYAIVAMADGVVERVHDGAFDHCTACGGDGCGTSVAWGYGNHVVVNHGDRKTIYAHMRTRSVRVAVGDRVTCGQTLGEIGSSGCSTGAHLHVETRPLGASATAAYDPFHGDCSSRASAWVDQGPYRGMPGPTCSDGSTPPPSDPPPSDPPPSGTTCPSGTYPIWTCTTDGTARRRCIDGRVEEEACSEGCVVQPVGTDDYCRAPSSDPPAAACPSGTYSIWTCTTDRTARRRCIDGRVEEEACAEGCVVQPVGTDDYCRASSPPPEPEPMPGTDAGPGSAPAPDAGSGSEPSPCVAEALGAGSSGGGSGSLSGGCSAGGGAGGAFAPLLAFASIVLVRGRVRRGR